MRSRSTSSTRHPSGALKTAGMADGAALAVPSGQASFFGCARAHPAQPDWLLALGGHIHGYPAAQRSRLELTAG